MRTRLAGINAAERIAAPMSFECGAASRLHLHALRPVRLCDDSESALVRIPDDKLARTRLQLPDQDDVGILPVWLSAAFLSRLDLGVAFLRARPDYRLGPNSHRGFKAAHVERKTKSVASGRWPTTFNRPSRRLLVNVALRAAVHCVRRPFTRTGSGPRHEEIAFYYSAVFQRRRLPQ